MKYRMILASFLAIAIFVPSLALAQGAKTSSPIELAEAMTELKPGQWVWAPQIAPEGPVLVVVDLSEQMAFIYRNGVNIGVSTISSGKPGHETPTGVFQILQKDANHHSSKYNNAPMPFQERLTWDGVALHAGGLPGYPESHGCIHLPYEFAKKLFQITAKGGTVVVSGRASAPVRTGARGVLTPFDERANNAEHQALSENEEWVWDLRQSAEGPLSLVISTSDQEMVVLQNGREIARARAKIDGHAGTHVATLHRAEDGRMHWIMVGVPGHEGEANHVVDATALERLRVPHAFREKLLQKIGEGTTVLVTSGPLDPAKSGKPLTLLAAND